MKLMTMAKMKAAAVMVATVGVIGGSAGVVAFKAMAADAPAPVGDTVSMTILESKEGLWGAGDKGTIWRYWETWRTDICKTGSGELIPVDPFNARQIQNDKDEWVNESPHAWALFQPIPSKLQARVRKAERTMGSPWPSNGWQQPDFDDNSWGRIAGPFRPWYRAIALMCLRGKFEVKDPAKVAGLDLTMTFQGGAVVYLNGKEVGRANMPKGAITPESLAEDYPLESFVGANNAIIYNPYSGGGFYNTDPKGSYHPSRSRKMAIQIPAGALIKGVNVLAVEIHRSAALEAMFTPTITPNVAKENGGVSFSKLSRHAWWNRVGIEDVKFSAQVVKSAETNVVISNISRKDGLQVWHRVPEYMTAPGGNPYFTEQVTPVCYADPNEKPPVLKANGLRNGTYSMEMFVGDTKPIEGLKVVVSDLTGPVEKKISASAITVTYPGMVGWWSDCQASQFEILEPVPPAEIKAVRVQGLSEDNAKHSITQPVWLLVRIPATAGKGLYSGTATVTADGCEAIQVPVRVNVASDWVMPMPRDFAISVFMMQSPDSVAYWYNVPLWSEKHWKLLDQEFEVLASIGNQEVVIPLVAQTHAGNRYTMAYWIPQADGTFKYDFTNVERYIDLAIKHQGKIPDVNVISNYGHFGGKDVQQLYTEKDPVTGVLTNKLTPFWGTPEAMAFWSPVMEEMKKILAKRGLEKSFTHFAGQYSKGSLKGWTQLNQMVPGAKYMTRSHDLGDPNPMIWNKNWMYRSHMSGAGVYFDPDDAGQPGLAWRAPLDCAAFGRDGGAAKAAEPGLNNASPRLAFRIFPEKSALIGKRGLGQWGADFWPVVFPGGDSKKSVVLCKAYCDEGSTGVQVCVPSLVAPGRNGPVPSMRFQMILEGLQDVEARRFVQDALLDQADKLGSELAKKVKSACDDRTRELRAYTQFQYDGETQPTSLEDLNRRLYELTGEVAKALGN